MHLYELTTEINQLRNLDDVPEEALQDTLESLSGEFAEKAVNIRHVIKEFEAQIEAIDAESKRLSAMKKTIGNRVESLENYLRENMIAAGIDKLPHAMYPISLRKAPQVVEIVDESLLPRHFIITHIEQKPDKKLMLEVLKEGEKIPGAQLGLGKVGLVIK